MRASRVCPTADADSGREIGRYAHCHAQTKETSGAYSKILMRTRALKASYVGHGSKARQQGTIRKDDADSDIETPSASSAQMEEDFSSHSP